MKIQVLTSEYEYMGLPLGLVVEGVTILYSSDQISFTYNGKGWVLSRGEYKECLQMTGTDAAKTKPIKSDEKYDPLAVQVGGGHYKGCKIQPIEYIFANNLGYAEGNIVKYVTRWRDKNGVEDLKKVIHYAELLIQEEEKKDE